MEEVIKFKLKCITLLKYPIASKSPALKITVLVVLTDVLSAKCTLRMKSKSTH